MFIFSAFFRLKQPSAVPKKPSMRPRPLLPGDICRWADGMILEQRSEKSCFLDVNVFTDNLSIQLSAGRGIPAKT